MYYVTGIFGSGKSAVCKELTNRGYLAYDDGEYGITRWREKSTGKFLGKAKRTAGPNGSKLELYDWHLSKDKMLELAKATAKPILFICGTADNRHELWYLFDEIFCLKIDEEILVHRLASRSDNDFGKDPKDLKEILELHRNSEQADIKAGAIMIDSLKPVKEVVNEILATII